MTIYRMLRDNRHSFRELLLSHRRCWTLRTIDSEDRPAFFAVTLSVLRGGPSKATRSTERSISPASKRHPL